MPLSSGTRLGPYEILAPVGAGGMGEVFRARDTRLHRDVAIKVLPTELARDHERVARFKREAQILASLNHSNIAGIYGLEEDPATGVVALAMEFVEGEDLAQRLPRGAIPIDDSIAIAKQIAEALEEAHEHGIIHRDLKPGNVKVTPDGKVKVLDFGLAKALEGEPSSAVSADVSHSPTMSRHATEAGMILGTAAYMSPEQARGKKVDKRADIWSFGVVLYEMLTGERLFSGETVSDVLAAVLTRDADFSRLPAKTPIRVIELLRRCLDRNVKNRLHDIADARFALDEVLGGAASAPLQEKSSRPSAKPPLLAFATLLLIGLGLGAWMGRSSRLGNESAPAAFKGIFEITPPDKTLFVSGLAISNDGQTIAFVARGEDGRTRLYVRPIDEAQSKELPGTVDARYPFWAPDGRRLGFFAQNKLRVTDLLGGVPRAIADTGSSEDVRGAAWGAGDRIVFAPSYTGGLFEVAATGGAVTPATEIAGALERTHRFPSFLPDGQRFVFYESPGTGDEPGELYLGRLGGAVKPKKLGTVTSSAVYVDPSFLLYVQGDSLVARHFNSEQEELEGEPIPVGVSLPGSVTVSGQRSLAVSRTGVLVYRMDKRSATRLVWVDRAGAELKSITADLDTWHYGPTLSPDGRKLVVSHYESGATSGGVWVHDLERNLASRLAADDKNNDTVVPWSPDGKEVSYASAAGGDARGRINRIAVADASRARPIFIADTFVSPNVWLPDGKGIIYTAMIGAGRGRLMMRSFAENAQPIALGGDQVSEFGADLSPDGGWIAFQSDPTRRMEVYLRKLDDRTGTSTVRISSEGGTSPRFRRDGREIFYLAASGKLMSVSIKSMNPPEPGTPTPLFDGRLEAGSDRQYDVSPDGSRFILNRTLTQEQVPITVLINWQARLRTAGDRR